jgi:undecaprenyl-diphosphatase
VTLLEAIVLAVVQGLTEFLPISSTAHMKIVPVLLGWKDPGSAFSAVIQIGTLVAVLAYFWQDVTRILTAMLVDLRGRKIGTTHDAQMGWMIAAGTVPILIFGWLFEKQIDTSVREMYVICAALAGVAILLAVAEIFVRRRIAAGHEGRSVDQIFWRDAIIVGLAQACALVPGTSRSGATILGGLSCGLSREAAARFSFLLSIPAVLIAGLYKLYKERHALLGSQDQVVQLVVALVVTGLVGYATIPWLLGFLRSHSTFVFIVYRLLLAALLVALLINGTIASG